ncbi:hypothetical protein A7M79_00555 [Acinetobacter baumannii]|uniref:hypothetical protein n=1 Tax=Acinetobacter baumannii TaxID=470 RepID=UPI0008DE3EA7|nr:hypothetical protein [Acinetobacter baumannii]OIH12015.1 hypothetical protein A7M79_00555 [Acinetobacter baumannii]
MQLNMRVAKFKTLLKKTSFVVLLASVIYGYYRFITWVFESYLGGFTFVKYLVALFLFCVVLVYVGEIKKDRLLKLKQQPDLNG